MISCHSVLSEISILSQQCGAPWWSQEGVYVMGGGSVFTRKMKSGLLLLREVGEWLSDVSSELWEEGWRKVWPLSLESHNSCSSNSVTSHRTSTQRRTGVSFSAGHNTHTRETQSHTAGISWATTLSSTWSSSIWFWPFVLQQFLYLTSVGALFSSRNPHPQSKNPNPKIWTHTSKNETTPPNY